LTGERKGEIKKGGYSHDVVENKHGDFHIPTMLMKTNRLSRDTHDVNEKEG
jgi:hypothetical protein